jgi:hypothetical protein
MFIRLRVGEVSLVVLRLGVLKNEREGKSGTRRRREAGSDWLSLFLISNACQISVHVASMSVGPMEHRQLRRNSKIRKSHGLH